MKPTIRTCRSGDLLHIERLYADLHGGCAPQAEEQPLGERLGEFFLVAEENGRVIGFVIAARGPVDVIGREMAHDAFPGEAGYLEVQDIYVAPERRNCGIGSSLLATVLRRGAARGLNRSMVYSTNEDYARIGRFYERCGYRVHHLFMKR